MDSAINNMIAAAKRGNLEAARELVELLCLQQPAFAEPSLVRALAEIYLDPRSSQQVRELFPVLERTRLGRIVESHHFCQLALQGDQQAARDLTQYLLDHRQTDHLRLADLDTIYLSPDATAENKELFRSLRGTPTYEVMATRRLKMRARAGDLQAVSNLVELLANPASNFQVSAHTLADIFFGPDAAPELKPLLRSLKDVPMPGVDRGNYYDEIMWIHWWQHARGGNPAAVREIVAVLKASPLVHRVTAHELAAIFFAPDAVPELRPLLESLRDTQMPGTKGSYYEEILWVQRHGQASAGDEEAMRELVQRMLVKSPVDNENTNAEMLTRYFLSPSTSPATRRYI